MKKKDKPIKPLLGFKDTVALIKEGYIPRYGKGFIAGYVVPEDNPEIEIKYIGDD